MTITKLADISPINSPQVTPGSNPMTTMVTAAVGSTVILVGFVTQPITSIMDTNGNVWTVHSGLVSSTMILVECQVTVAMSNTTLTVTRTRAETGFSLGGAVFSKCALDKFVATTSDFSIANPSAPMITTQIAGELVIGCFWAYGSTPYMRITTPGSGYTNMAGAGADDPMDDLAHGMDWEYKIAGAAGNETPTATIAADPYASRSLTAAFMESAPNQMQGVV